MFKVGDIVKKNKESFGGIISVGTRGVVKKVSDYTVNIMWDGDNWLYTYSANDINDNIIHINSRSKKYQ